MGLGLFHFLDKGLAVQDDCNRGCCAVQRQVLGLYAMDVLGLAEQRTFKLTLDIANICAKYSWLRGVLQPFLGTQVDRAIAAMVWDRPLDVRPRPSWAKHLLVEVHGQMIVGRVQVDLRCIPLSQPCTFSCYQLSTDSESTVSNQDFESPARLYILKLRLQNAGPLTSVQFKIHVDGCGEGSVMKLRGGVKYKTFLFPFYMQLLYTYLAWRMTGLNAGPWSDTTKRSQTVQLLCYRERENAYSIELYNDE